MEFEDFKRAWQARPEGAPARDECVADDVRRRLGALHAQLRRRDLIETAVAIVAAVVFARMLWTLHGIQAKSGSALLVAGALSTVARVYAAKRRQPPPRDVPLAEFCRLELAAVNAQITLLRSVLWWYIGPVILGTNLVVVGLTGSASIRFGYAAVTLALGAWIYGLNERAVRDGLLPLRRRLERSVHELREDPAMDRGESL